MIRQVKFTDLERCFEIERIAYDGDEAASRAQIKTRIERYPEGFWVLESEAIVIGLLNSACVDQVDLADDSIKNLVGHRAGHDNLVITSLAIHPGYQRKGYAGQLLKHAIKQAKAQGMQTIYLMCQQYLIPFYTRHGFTSLGLSASNHGGLQWYEMRYSLVEQQAHPAHLSELTAL